MLRISMSSLGRSFATRMRAQEVVTVIWEQVQAERQEELVLDFSNVSVISGSFADEFVGALQKRCRVRRGSVHKIQIQNANPFVGKIIKAILTRRESSKACPIEQQNEAMVFA